MPLPKILIIDDHPRFLQTLSFALEDEHEILLAKSGEEGLAIMKNDRPDLVLLDYFMPGLDGLDVLVRLQAWADPPRVILMSARMTEHLRQEARELGAVDCLEKPFDLPCLRGKIDKALGNTWSNAD